MPAAKKSSAKPKPGAAKPGMPKEAADALAKVEPELAKLDPNDLAPINVDIPRAVSVAIGAVPHLNALRGSVVEELPKWPIRNLDQLGTYALAVWYAYLLAMPHTSAAQLDTLLEEATPLREDLLVAAEALAHKGFLDPKSVKAIREGQGHLDKANDLVALSALFAGEWDKVKAKTTVEWTEVERAAKLGPELLVALGAREQPGIKLPDGSDPAQRCARAFTLFVRAYDECRRVVSFLRWHADDVDSIAPSLFANRGRKAPTKASPEGEEPGATDDSSGSALTPPPGT